MAERLALALRMAGEGKEDRLNRVFEFFSDRFAEWQLERFQRSFYNADRLERRARLRVVTELVLELEEIKKVSMFSTALGQGAIEDVIEGDWRRVADNAVWFRFDEESVELRERYAPLWSKFVAILQGAAAEAKLRAAGTPTKPS